MTEEVILDPLVCSDEIAKKARDIRLNMDQNSSNNHDDNNNVNNGDNIDYNIEDSIDDNNSDYEIVEELHDDEFEILDEL